MPIRASLLLAAAILAIVAAPAVAADGLDPGFGTHGSLTFVQARNGAGHRSHFFEMVPDPLGGFFVASPVAIFKYGNSGERDPTFGQDGRVAIAVPPDRIFTPAGIAVDQRGRILLAGTSALTGVPSQQLALRESRIARYLPSGEPDPTFGEGGAIEGTLDLPRPYYYPRYDAEYGFPFFDPLIASASVSAIALDSSGRPLIGGSYVSSLSYSYPYSGYDVAHHAYVRRLSLSGALEPGFAPIIGDGSRVTSLIPRSRGDVLFATTDERYLERGIEIPPGAPYLHVRDSTADGGVAPDFDPSVLAFPFRVDSRDRLLYGGTGLSGSPSSGSTISRMNPNGHLDARFAHGGIAHFPAPTESWLRLAALDGGGQSLLAGSVPWSPHGQGTKSLLVRLSSTGKLDRGFGRRGYARFGFGRNSSSEAFAVLRCGEGLLVANRVEGKPNGNRIVIVKYLPSG